MNRKMINRKMTNRKMTNRKITKLMLASLLSLSSLGLTKVDRAEAVGLNYGALSSQDKVVFKAAGGTSNAFDITSNITIKKDVPSPSAYQWTAWYNRKTKNFTIDKSKTSGNYKNGFPKKTTSATTSTNFNKVGYYKYLRDPIYNKITLTAKQTFTWKTNEKKTKKETVSKTNNGRKCKEESARFMLTGDWQSLYTDIASKNRLPKESGKSASAIAKLIKKNYKEDVISEDTAVQVRYRGTSNFSFTVGDTKTTINTTVMPYGASSDGGVEYYNITLKWTCVTKRTYYEEKSHTKTLEIAKTQVASNVSATELAKYSNFKLLWKGGNTAAKNTAIKKNNAGWWGSHKPAYHTGNANTKDTGGGSHYYTWSTSGTKNSINLYNLISKKEKLFTEHAVDLTIPQNPDYKYTVKIDPNGGKYKNSTNIQSISGKVNTIAQIQRPTRENYTFLGWDYTGEGTWNASSGTYTFTGDGLLKAKWLKVTNPDNPGGNGDNGGNGGGITDPEGPGTPPGPTNPLPEDKDPNTKYTLRIDPNGGKYNYKTGITTTTAKIGTYCSINMPTRNGYIFDGWKVVSGNSNYLTQSKYYLNSTYVFYGNATIQAKWLKVGQTTGEVTIDPNGGSYEGSTTPTKISKPTGTTIPIKTPIREGYLFIGWDIDTNNDINGIFNTSSNSFLFKRGQSILRARWKKYNPPSCVMDGTGPNACPDSENETLNKFVHLTKNPD